MPPSKPDRPSVLIVDDEPQVTVALADVLDDLYNVVTETCARAALARLEANPDIAVILSDQRMPGMTGDEFLARARMLSSATRILITAYADIAAVIKAVNEGKIFAYVTKPWDADDIVRTVTMAAEYCSLHREIMQERTLLHQIMESSVDAIAIKDRNCRYVKANRREALLLRAASAADLEGRTVADFLPPERSESRLRVEDDVMKTGSAALDRIETSVTVERGTCWYSSNMTPIRDPAGEITGLIGITRDVTESKRLDEMKDQFIATVRHELRSPLTAIHASLGLLRAGTPDAIRERAARLIRIGHDNCGRLLSLVDDLLDTVRLENGEMAFGLAPVGVPDLLSSAAGASRGLALERGLAMSVDAMPPSIEVIGDRERLLQALAKLLSNAIEMSPAGECIMLKARIVDGDAVRVSVVDRGPGVPREIAARIFERFAQGDSSNARQKAGVGLGLYIAKSIVEAHGGRIDFVNRKRGGAEFFFELPLHHSVATAAATGAALARP